MNKTIYELNEEVKKASWKTPTCELEQIKLDISEKMNDNGISAFTYIVLSEWYERIHRLTFKETTNPDYIIKNEFGEKVGLIKINNVFGKKVLVDLWLYHEKIGCMSMDNAIKKCNELSLYIKEV
jgi:hypothetical protein